MLLNAITTFAGLDTLETKLQDSWIGPAFMILLGVLAIGFMVRRQWMAMVTFLAFATVVGIIIFRTDTFFGDNGVLTNTGANFGTDTFNSIQSIPKTS